MRLHPVHSTAAGRSWARRTRAAAAPGVGAPGVRRRNLASTAARGRHSCCLPPHTTSQAVVEEQQQQSQQQQSQPEDVLSLLQASMPADSSLQQLLEPLLPVEQQHSSQQHQSQQPHMPGDDVAEIAAPSSTSLTVGGGAAATRSSTSTPQLIDVEAREVPRSWRRTHAPEPAPAVAEQPSAPFIVSPAGVAEQLQPQQLLQQQGEAAQQQQQHEEAAQQQQQTAMHWGRVVGVCGFAALLCYLDRTNISTAIVPMAEQYGWNKQFCSVVMSAFFAGYGATQVLGGQLSDRFGGSAVLAAGLVGWSLATVLTPLAASAGMWPLLAARAVLGMAQGIAFPAIHSLLAKKVPSKVRSGAIGIIMALAHCGTAIGFGASPGIIQGLGWGWTFYLFGGASLLWLVSWAHMERDRGTNNARATAAAFINFNRRKAESGAAIVEAAAAAVARKTGSNNIVSSARLSAALRPVAGDGTDSSSNKAAATAQHPILEALEQQQQQQQKEVAPVAAAAASQQPAASSVPYGFWPLMRRREIWAIAIAQYAAGWGFYGLLAWLPQFFIQHLGVSLSQLGGFTLAPYLAQAVFGSTAGLLADNLITRRKWAIRDVRVLMQGVGMLGPAACLFAAASPFVHSPYVATGLITLGMGLSAFTCAGVSASHLEVAPRHAGVIFGVGNTAGTLAGLVAVPGLGYVLQHTGNWSLAFGLAAVHNVIGALLWAKWVGDKPLPEDGPSLEGASDAPATAPQQQQQLAPVFGADADGGVAGHMKLKAA